MTQECSARSVGLQFTKSTEIVEISSENVVNLEHSVCLHISRLQILIYVHPKVNGKYTRFYTHTIVMTRPTFHRSLFPTPENDIS